MSEPFPSAPIVMPSTINAPSTEKTIHDDIGAALAAIPDGHTHGLFVDATFNQATGGAAQLIYAEKVNNAWSLVGGIDYDGVHGVEGKIETQITW